jgi:uncharacterized protein (DUF58 family)
VLIPTRRTLGLIAVLTGAGLAVAFDADLVPAFALLALAAAAALITDALIAWMRGCPVDVGRTTALAWSVGVGELVTLELRTMAPATPVLGALQKLAPTLVGNLIDGYPSDCKVTGQPCTFALAPGQLLKIAYRAIAPDRGLHTFVNVEIRLASVIGLWTWRARCAVGPTSVSQVRVFPDFARIAHYTLLAIDNRLSQIGVMRRRRRGEGMEFRQLREYRDGDSPRSIDWKATGRQGKLIAREYQDERNQQIVFLLDCGLRMRAREVQSDEGEPPLSHFDHTLNAMLLLSYVALRQGDGIGMSTFSHETPRHFAPRRSQATLKLLMNSVYDLEPSLLAPDFLKASEDLLLRLRKRSLVVVLTNLRDEDDDTLGPAMSLLRRRHLTLVASLREPGLAQLRSRPVDGFDAALAYASATEYLMARDRTIASLRKKGVQCIDVEASSLPIALVNQYWHMKRSGIL